MATLAVGIIGAGRIGTTLARLAVEAGHTVVLSNSRGPESLREVVAELGPSARAATPVHAADASDLVVASVPVHAYSRLPVEPLRGKIVIDTLNYDPRLHGDIPEFMRSTITTSEHVQAHLRESRVVKACNNIFFRSLRSLARSPGSADRSALPIAGDDTRAKEAAARFLDELGYDTVDAGPLREGWRWQPGTPAHLVYAGETVDTAVPAGVVRLRASLAAAHR